MKNHLIQFRLLTLISAISIIIFGCSSLVGSSAKDIQEHIDKELSVELSKIKDKVDEVKTFFCRKGKIESGIFSARSFSGRLCQDKYVNGLKLLGGAALLLCWDSNLEDFQDSSCAKNALEDYGLKASAFSKQKLVELMKPIVAEYLKKAESASGADDLPYYAGAKTIFCLLPSSLMAPGEDIHSMFCK